MKLKYFLLLGTMWHTFVIPALRRLRQDDKFRASLGLQPDLVSSLFFFPDVYL
jgi:hypothetical protein